MPNGAHPDVVAQCREGSQCVFARDATLPMVVGITRTDEAPAFDLAGVREGLRSPGINAPVLTFDARDRQQTSRRVQALLLLTE